MTSTEESTAASTEEATVVDPWINSKAKKLLRDDIILGKVTGTMTPEAVFQMRKEYKDYKFERFKDNLKNLIAAVNKDVARMQKDCEFYGHDCARLMQIRSAEPPRPVSWHQSDARILLKQDMAEGKHERMKPRDLFISRPEYKDVFDLETFRNAIYNATDKKEKLRFRMEKKKFRARGPEPQEPMEELPN